MQSNLLGGTEEGEVTVTSPEAQTTRLLRLTANLLNNVAEAAWTNDIPSPAKWELHRIGTAAYIAQRDILHMLGQPGEIAKPQADFNITAALEEAVQVISTIPEEFQTMPTHRLQAGVASLAGRAEGVFILLHSIGRSGDSDSVA